MNTHLPQKPKEKLENNNNNNHDHQDQENQKQNLPISKPPSPSSSPSHEFSFTISLHSSSTPEKTKSKSPLPNSFAIDLSPADDIFFHGHLLPLHLLSHLPVSPRASTNSLDSFSLPITELPQAQNPNPRKSNTKPKSFSLLRKWRKGFEDEDKEDKEKQKRKLRFDLRHVLRRYVKMVRPLLLFGRRENKNVQLRRQPYSFSGNLSSLRNDHKKDYELGGRRGGEFSAPASMRTSPTNSGLLVATTQTVSGSSSDSTMEELQAAIQAAIAHCKNSISVDEKLKCMK